MNLSTGQILLTVDSCNGAPHAVLRLGADYLEIEVSAFSTVWDDDDCLDLLEVSPALPNHAALPFQILDSHTGRLLELKTSP
ncbi:MAG TPA: hypothetical protein QF905_03690 [Acidimicrobiales bacterium]|nr:hypothetical protein [Actinomycetota bacterium]MDP6176500.1 hypothetical protein [Acidimicrobiales bacterium]MDP6214056.1 hypothetical protein [Acidimicrobiales bacterium]HJL89417.1 hypothetical protein [Acidimicrobiales bacterium]HJO99169.1 hypothetical protein [Acidimicrobiales bacterium]